MLTAPEPTTFPRLLDSYPPPAASLLDTLSARIAAEPFNAVASAIFGLAILHTFAAARFTALAHGVQHRHAERQRQLGRPEVPSVLAEALHFLGEVEVVFGLWAIVLLAAITSYFGWHTAAGYFNGTVNYTEPLFVIVIMALASTRPIILLAEDALRVLARVGKGTPAAWWATILIVGPLLGSFITEPGAMTICALLLGRQFYDLQPSARLKYATLGLLFVNVSIGGTLTHFAAPPVLMVARPWDWDTPFMLAHFGWRAVVAIVASVVVYGLIFRRELAELGTRRAVPDVEVPEEDASAGSACCCRCRRGSPSSMPCSWPGRSSRRTIPRCSSAGSCSSSASSAPRRRIRAGVELKAPLLVGFFLAGLVIHGGLQGWWIAPVLASLSETPLFATATILTAFNDNALITYLATLVPNLSDGMKAAVMEGAVTGGGLTVIANAPNPAGQAILGRYFGGAVLPIWLLAGALLPTLMAVIAFRLL